MLAFSLEPCCTWGISDEFTGTGRVWLAWLGAFNGGGNGGGNGGPTTVHMTAKHF